MSSQNDDTIQFIFSDLKMTSWLVPPSSPTGNNHHIELAGTDLWITGCVNNVFVYQSALDVDQVKDALGRTLSLWPIIAGRFLVLEGEHYIIEMSDNGIPVSFVENINLPQWPLDLNVVIDQNSKQLQPFLDKVQTEKLKGGSQDEPLFRLKLTHLVQSGEWIMGASWSHIVGDADAFLKFLNTISCLYQQMKPPEPMPVFKRRLWLEDEADERLLTDIEKFLDGEQMKRNDINNQDNYDQINICFSGPQLAKLKSLIPGDHVTKQDTLCAYIVLTLNTHCTETGDQLIKYANIMIDYRYKSDLVEPSSLVANAVLMPLSDGFKDSTSLSSIAKTIRQTIVQSRDVKFIERWVATADKVMRSIVHEDRLPKMSTLNDRIILNSNWGFDWASLVDFGQTDKCRFYTQWTRALYLRIFRLNPVYDGTQWIGRDKDGAEVAFRIKKDKKQKFIDACNKDIVENFINVNL